MYYEIIDDIIYLDYNNSQMDVKFSLKIDNKLKNNLKWISKRNNCTLSNDPWIETIYGLLIYKVYTQDDYNIELRMNLNNDDYNTFYEAYKEINNGIDSSDEEDSNSSTSTTEIY